MIKKEDLLPCRICGGEALVTSVIRGVMLNPLFYSTEYEIICPVCKIWVIETVVKPRKRPEKWNKLMGKAE